MSVVFGLAEAEIAAVVAEAHDLAVDAALGYLYEAHLRSELTARLGVRWTKAIESIADIEGVPLDELGAFWTRRAEIEERLAIGGWSSTRAAEIAALTTRKANTHDVDPTTLRSRWREQAREMGFGPRQPPRQVPEPDQPCTPGARSSRRTQLA